MLSARLTSSILVVAALACVERGPAVSEDETETETTGDDQALRPSWHEDIAPLIHGSCVGCHHDGGIAPFALETYAQASAWAALISETVDGGIMPPWAAVETDECQPEHAWRDDLRWSDAHKQLLADWVEAGTPEGDPNNAASLPEPPSLDLPDPTVVLQNPSPFTIGGSSDSFICMVVDPDNQHDVWITGVQLIPDNPEVVHHVLTYIDTNASSDSLIDGDGKFPCPGGFVDLDGARQISTWVPGSVPTQTPPGVAFHLPVGSRIIMAYHYHPSGAGDEVDQSSIALRWTDEQPELEALMAAIGAVFSDTGIDPGPNDPDGVPVFEIPPNVPDHVESVTYVLPDFFPTIEVFAMGTHMHYVGVDMKISIERDGEELCWIHTPRWDFNWQRLYDVDAPLGQLPTFQGGDIVKLRCTYNNTLDNPALAEILARQGLSEPIAVGVGESSLDEMCGMLVGFATNLPFEDFF